MQRKPIATALAFAGMLALSASSFAADTGGNTNSKTGANAAAQTGTTGQAGTTGTSSTGSTGMSGSTGSTSSGAMSSGTTAGTQGQSFDKTGAESGWNSWYDAQAKRNNGRISRQAYMDEVGRRWDSMDSSKQGLTPAEVSRMYGNVDSAAGPARTGSGVQPGNMGPGNQKGK